MNIKYIFNLIYYGLLAALSIFIKQYFESNLGWTQQASIGGAMGVVVLLAFCLDALILQKKKHP